MSCWSLSAVELDSGGITASFLALTEALKPKQDQHHLVHVLTSHQKSARRRWEVDAIFSLDILRSPL